MRIVIFHDVPWLPIAPVRGHLVSWPRVVWIWPNQD